MSPNFIVNSVTFPLAPPSENVTHEIYWSHSSSDDSWSNGLITIKFHGHANVAFKWLSNQLVDRKLIPKNFHYWLIIYIIYQAKTYACSML